MNAEALIPAIEPFLAQPWAVPPDTLAALLLAAERGAAAELLGRATTARAPAPLGGVHAVPSSVAIVAVHGVLIPRGQSPLLAAFGLASCEAITRELRQAAADPEVKTIILDVDSPGGSVTGVQELAATVAKVRESRRVVVVANAYAASGAYWIASQADELVVTPSGMVGAIGVITAHTDLSGAFAKAGVKRTYVTAGRHKAEGNPTAPLSDDARAYLQQQVDTIFGAFTRDVARGRGVGADVVRGSTFGGGRLVLAAAAVRAGLADAVATLDATIRRHGVGGAIPVGASRRRFDARLADIEIARLA